MLHTAVQRQGPSNATPSPAPLRSRRRGAHREPRPDAWRSKGRGPCRRLHGTAPRQRGRNAQRCERSEERRVGKECRFGRAAKEKMKKVKKKKLSRACDDSDRRPPDPDEDVTANDP